MSNFSRYDSYKDSGVDWLGEVPAHWDLTRLGTRFSERRTKVSDKDFPPLSVTKQGVLPQLETAAKTNDGDNRKLVKSGDFVINSRSDRKGSSGISRLDGSVSLINIVLEPKEIEPIYCNYLLKSNNFIEEFYRMGHGIVADLWTTRYDEMKAIKIAIPPIFEQTAIAEFLDRKTSQIDQAIAQKERLIELLQERRQILIHNAVTRGLYANVKLKHSGIKWIGEIPEHWKVVSNFALFDERNEAGNENLPILMVSIHTAVSSEEISDEENIRGKVRIEDKTSYKLVKPGDVAFNMMRAWQGAIGEVKAEGMVSPAYIVAKPKSEFSSHYLEFQFRTQDYIQQIDRFSKGITDFRKRLYWNEFKRLKTVLPPFTEQREISKFIESLNIKIEAAISRKHKEIEKLKEYKAVLVNSAVTGKIKVFGNSQNAEMKANYA